MSRAFTIFVGFTVVAVVIVGFVAIERFSTSLAVGLIALWTFACIAMATDSHRFPHG